MKFIDWLYSTYPNPKIEGEWGTLHIITLVAIIAMIVASSLLLKNKSDKTKRIVLWVMCGIIIFFEVARRVINLCKTTDYSVLNIFKILLPRPGCAISDWLVVIALIVNKKFFYNFASIVSILCGTIFFAYPGAGFNNEIILFENLYSIVAHAMFYIVAICFITYKFTDFKYKNCWKELICFAVLIVYTFLEIYFKIESDPFYFVANNDIQDIVGMAYSLYLPMYLIFICVYVNLYYLIGDRKNIFKRRK